MRSVAAEGRALWRWGQASSAVPAVFSVVPCRLQARTGSASSPYGVGGWLVCCCNCGLSVFPSGAGVRLGFSLFSLFI